MKLTTLNCKLLLVMFLLLLSNGFPAVSKVKKKFSTVDFVSGIEPDLQLFIKNTQVDLNKSSSLNLRIDPKPLYKAKVKINGFKIEVYEIIDGSRNFVSSNNVTVKKNQKGFVAIKVEAGDFNTDTKELEFDIYNTNEQLINTYSAQISAINLADQVETESAANTSNCEDDNFSYESFFNNITFEVRPESHLITNVQKLDNCRYKVILPLLKWKKPVTKKEAIDGLRFKSSNAADNILVNLDISNVVFLSGAQTVADKTLLNSTLDGTLTILPKSAGAGKVLTSDANGKATWQSISSTGGGGGGGGVVNVINQSLTGQWQDGTGGDIFFNVANGDVGIGVSTPNPQAKLHVNGRLLIAGGAPGVGKVLTSDVNGLASWAVPGALISEYADGGEARTKNRILGNTDNFNLDIITNNIPRLSLRNSGNVGVGYVNPTEKLHVNGNLLVRDSINGTNLYADTANISGTVTGGSFVGGGSGLTGLNATLITSGTLAANRGGTGVANATGSLTFTDAITLTTSGITNVALPSSGTLATLAGAEMLSNKTISGLNNALTNIPITNLTIASEQQGDILYYSGTNWTRLPKGPDTQVLTSNGATGVPYWSPLNAIVDFKNGGDVTGTHRSLGNTTNFNLDLLTNNTPVVHLSNSGNVGIGTTAPLSKLQMGTLVSTPTASPVTLSLGGTYSSTGGTNPKLKLYDIGATSYGLGASLNSLDYMVATGATHNWYIGNNIYMRMGNIGVTAPGAENAYVTGDHLILWNQADFKAAIGVGNYQTWIQSSGNLSSNIAFFTDGAAGGAPLERMRIDSSGNVGINTAGPTGKLDVNDNKLRVRSSQTPLSSGAACNQGEIAWDSSYIYVCVSANTWKRSAIATW